MEATNSTNATLDIDLLRTFHAIARLRQFRAAAEHVHRSPAAVSMHIQRLEAVAGGRLLERDNQSVTLTPLGQRLLTSTTELLRTHDKVLNDLHGKAMAGRIKLGMSDEYAVRIIRDILPLFAASWPNVVLDVSTFPSLALRDQIARGRLHVALVVLPLGKKPHPAALSLTTPVWVAGAGMAEGDKPVLPDPMPLALHVADCPYREAMIALLAKAGRKWRVVLSSPSSQAVEACVESGLAVSMVDRSRVTARMRVLEHLPTPPAHEVLLLRSASAQDDPAAQLLDKTIRQHFSM